MQPSMSNVMITTASPPAPLLLERGVDSEFPYLLILYFMKYFIHFICSIVSYKFLQISYSPPPLRIKRGVDSEFPYLLIIFYMFFCCI